MIEALLREYDKWWTSLPINQKERIATKLLKLTDMRSEGVMYPRCTEVWLTASDTHKQELYELCTSSRGLAKDYLTEGWTFSY